MSELSDKPYPKVVWEVIPLKGSKDINDYWFMDCDILKVTKKIVTIRFFDDNTNRFCNVRLKREILDRDELMYHRARGHFFKLTRPEEVRKKTLGYLLRSKPYDKLGLPEKADRDEVKKAFRKLAQIHHPDKGGDPAMYVEIKAAYESILSQDEDGELSLADLINGIRDIINEKDQKEDVSTA